MGEPAAEEHAPAEPEPPAQHARAVPPSRAPGPPTLARRAAVLRDHRELIQAIKDQDADQAAEIISRHVLESGHYVMEQMRAKKIGQSEET